MSTTLQTRLVGGLTALALGFLLAPVAFAEETETPDWETKASEKIELVENLLADAEVLIDEIEEASDDRVEAEEDLAEAEADLDEAIASFDATEYEDAYNEAVEAYEEASELMDELTEDAKDDDEEYEDEDEEKDEDEYEKDRPAACDKNVRGRAYGLRALCGDEDRPVADRIAERKEKREARCDAAALDGEVDRKDYFCRNGEWREKREARLDDLLAGAVEAADLTDEQAEVIRDEMIDLIRQLITRLFQARLGS